MTKAYQKAWNALAARILLGAPIGKANDKGVEHEIRAAELAWLDEYAFTQDTWFSIDEWMGWMSHEPVHKMTKRERLRWDAGYLARQIVRHR